MPETKILGKGDMYMNTLFLKDFNNMSKEKLASAWTKCGDPEVTSRTFKELIGRHYTDIREVELLKGILDECNTGEIQLDFPALELLRIECGRSVTPATKLPENVLSYLLKTKYDIILSDYDGLITRIRDEFERRSAA